MRYSRTLALPVLLAAFSLGAGTTIVPRDAHAQNVSDADRKGARDLYNQAVTLQQTGKFAEALDAFLRSFSVYPAPTTALHVAQCQASLNHLVEAEESYRALANAKIPDGSPPAFYQAQDQAKAELPQIAPRVPTIKVITSPAQIPGVAITVDGQTMNSALVGAPRPVNPGTHRVIATAPGYSTAEQSVTVQEKESRDVPLTLRSTGVAVQPVRVTPQPVVGQQPTPMYGGGPAWGQPYMAMKRKSPGLYGGGIAMVVVGSVTTFIGLIVVLAGSFQNTSFGGVTSNSGSNTIRDGAIATGIGVALLAGGIAMMVVGGKKVPATEAMWIPKPSPGGLAWTF